MINLPTNPTLGEEIELDGVMYSYNGVGYEIVTDVLETKSATVSSDSVIVQDSENGGVYKVVPLADFNNTITEW